MKSLFISFSIGEQGQDLVEYSLILAFLCQASAALFIGAGGDVQTIWTNANDRLSAAAVPAGS